jgi:type II secretory pathway component PulM
VRSTWSGGPNGTAMNSVAPASASRRSWHSLFAPLEAQCAWTRAHLPEVRAARAHLGALSGGGAGSAARG